MTVIADAVIVSVIVGVVVVVATNLSIELDAVTVAVVVTVTGVGVTVIMDVTTFGPPKRLKPLSTVIVLVEVTNLVSVTIAPL